MNDILGSFVLVTCQIGYLVHNNNTAKSHFWPVPATNTCKLLNTVINVLIEIDKEEINIYRVYSSVLMIMVVENWFLVVLMVHWVVAVDHTHCRVFYHNLTPLSQINVHKWMVCVSFTQKIICCAADYGRGVESVVTWEEVFAGKSFALLHQLLYESASTLASSSCSVRQQAAAVAGFTARIRCSINRSRGLVNNSAKTVAALSSV